MSKLRLVVESVDLSSVLGDGGEGKDVVQVKSEGRVDVVDEIVDVLLRSL